MVLFFGSDYGISGVMLFVQSIISKVNPTFNSKP